MSSDIDRLLSAMRDGGTQRVEDITAFVAGVTDGSITRPQAAAWLAWAFARTLGPQETVALTRAMAGSGAVMRWVDGAPLTDKHSTGGVGDKVSLILAPLWAELGLRVPMVSGRGLGHTGGTLDKLEAIPGYRTDLDAAELARVLGDVGCFIVGQTDDLAPADRVLYALRNETRTVASIPLIVGSILSKKIAAGVERLVLDVKVGSGAFMKTHEDARALATALVDVATGAGLHCTACITDMDHPLGRTVGNALEVEEAVRCLRGEGPDDLRDVTLALADHPDAERVLASGAAYERFCAMVRAQGGDPRALDGGLAGAGCAVVEVCAPRAGVVAGVHAMSVGLAAHALGAGRDHAAAAIDMGVGVELLRVAGDGVGAGEPVFRVHHRDGRGLERARALLDQALTVADAAPPRVLVRDRVGA